MENSVGKNFFWGLLFLVKILFVFCALLRLFSNVAGVIGNGEISPYIVDIFGSDSRPANPVAVMAIVIIGALYVFYAMILSISRRYDKLSKENLQ